MVFSEIVDGDGEMSVGGIIKFIAKSRGGRRRLKIPGGVVEVDVDSNVDADADIEVDDEIRVTTVAASAAPAVVALSEEEGCR